MTASTRELILELAAREVGLKVAEMAERGIAERTAHKTIFKLRSAGLLHSAQAGLRATYFTDAFRAAELQAAWENSAAERKKADQLRYETNRNAKLGLPPPKRRVLQTPAEKEAIRIAKAQRMKEKRDAARLAAGSPMPTRTPNQRPALAAPVTIRASGRGPAYLPGEPDCSKAKWTYGPSPAQPTHTNTHAE